MAHGTPDWAEVAPKKTVYAGIDLAELAARLGSVNTFDRRGDTIFLDDFSSGLAAWQAAGTIPACTPVWSAKHARTKGFSCKLVTTATTGLCSWIRHIMPIPVISKIGLEFSFSLPFTNVYIQSEYYFWDGTQAYWFKLEYRQPEKTLNYVTTGGGYEELAKNVDLLPFVETFHTMKLVVDLINMRYVRAIVDSVEYPMTGFIPWQTAGMGSPISDWWIWMCNRADEAKEGFIDDAIITQNEP